MIGMKNVTAICIDGTPDGNRRDRLVQIWDALKSRIDFACIKHLSHVDPNCGELAEWHRIPRITNLAEYSGFVIADMPNYVDTDFCMTIHDDGFPINLHLWNQSFLWYDYIGAPWGAEANVYPHHYANGSVEGGNGGFSIRSRRILQLCKLIAEKYDPQSIQKRVSSGSFHEDGYICYELRNALKKNGVRFAPYELAKKFSLETDLQDSSNDVSQVFGFHGKRHLKFETAIQMLRRHQ